MQSTLFATFVLLTFSLTSFVGQEQAREKAAAKPTYPFAFRDVGDEAGLFPHVGKIQGHAAGWGDVDNDGWIDLYVATFHTPDSKPNMLFRNKKGKFQLDNQKSLRISTRATGSLFVDLDNDGDLDLYVGSMPAPKGSRLATRMGHPLRGCSLFRNEGKGKFTDVSKGNDACPAAFGGRSATALDYDGDGLLDLLVGEDPFPGYNGSKTKSTRLFRNKGNLQFEDVSRKVGLPEVCPGLGVASGDVNNDGWPDVYVASAEGGNRLFLNDKKGKLREVPDPDKMHAWKGSGGDNMVCGAQFADVNHDGLLDLFVGQHFSTPWLEPVAVRLYLNQGIRQTGVPQFENVTEKAGLTRLPLKAPHLELQDFDNDGLPDLIVSIVTFADGKPYPVIFKNLGIENGMPRFREDAVAQIDYPTAEDKAIKRSGAFFDKMIKDKKIVYAAPGPTCDFDNDGRLDVFLPNWWVESRSLLLRNETKAGNWLQIAVEGGKGVNRMGIGARINLYPAGQLAEGCNLLACREMSIGDGYASAQPALAHFGLGKRDKVDVEVILPHGKGKLTKKGVAANQRLTISAAN